MSKAARAAFRARMVAAQKSKFAKMQHHPRRGAVTRIHAKRPHAVPAAGLAQAKVVKHAADKMAHEMRSMRERLEAECKQQIRHVKKQAVQASGAIAGLRALGHKPKIRVVHHKARHPGHPAHVRHVGAHAPHHKKAARMGGAHERHEVTAASIIHGAKVGARRGRYASFWVCAGPKRTGCGGGARGGHVLGSGRLYRAERVR